MAEREDALRTRGQRYADAKWNRMFISRAMITSQAYMALQTATACQVLALFLTKCQWKRIQSRPGSRDRKWRIVNNGQIAFLYRDAAAEYGIAPKRFTRAIDELIRVGLLDIAKTGCGVHKDESLYAISDRWEKFGTDAFVAKERPRRVEQFGFTKGNGHGQKTRRPRKSQQSSTTVVSQSRMTVVGK